MPDINLRRAKHHLESVARAKVAQALPEDVDPAVTGINSVEVAPPIQNLERDPKMEGVSGAADTGSNEVANTTLDCGSSSEVNAAGTNQDKGTGDAMGNNEESSANNQVSLIQNAAVGDTEANDNLKPDSEQPPSSTSTTGTSSSVSSVFAVPTIESGIHCVGKPPLPGAALKSRKKSPQEQSMPQPTQALRTQGKL
ncbi:unnamed protein product [Phytophthora lilii]|uniref:Unnamed protein product n=1 Tax=Phytophthora lilii TaxID=2077276 RepID=A0A9W6WPJ5_9STRA|nr:unnamed protein product [Phytophthora lilii]